MKRLTEGEMESFERYARQNDTNPWGDQEQWADYTLRLIAEVREGRATPTPDTSGQIVDWMWEWYNREQQGGVISLSAIKTMIEEAERRLATTPTPDAAGLAHWICTALPHDCVCESVFCEHAEALITQRIQGIVESLSQRELPKDVAGLVEEARKGIDGKDWRDVKRVRSLLFRVSDILESLGRERAVLTEGFLAQRRLDSKGDFAILTDADEPNIQAVEAALALIGEGKE